MISGLPPNLRRGLVISLSIAVLVNLILLGIHEASRPGQTTAVEITTAGTSYRVVIDGKQALPAHGGPDQIDAGGPASGRLVIGLPYGAPSLPGTRGIDSIVVTAPDGRVLLRDDFNFLDNERWQVTSGSFAIEKGVLVALDHDVLSTLVLRGDGWGDTTTRVTFRNGTSSVIGVRETENADGLYYTFELQRDFPNFVNVVLGGVSKGAQYGGLIQTSKAQVMRSMGGMLTTSYGFMLLSLLIGALIAGALALVAPHVAFARIREQQARLMPRMRIAPATCAIAVLTIAAFLVTVRLNDKEYFVLPHVPDEVAYLFQAKLLAHGHFTAPIPPYREAFYFYSPSFLYENGDRWASFYPYGHPLVLAIGTFFGAVRFVPSIIGAGCVVLVYLVGRRIYGTRTGLIAAVLLASSPFFLMQSSSFMSHNTAAFLVLLSLFCIIHRDRPLTYGIAGGLAFGMLANTRPLAAVTLVPPYGLLLLTYLRSKEERLPAAKLIGAFVAGAIVAGGAYFLYNYALTGNPLTSPYAGNDPTSPIGFTNGNTFAVGLRNEQAQLQALLLVLNGWPRYVGLMFLVLPFALGTRNAWDYFCVAGALITIAAYVLYQFSGVYEGPRYWYETVPFLILLSARGFECAATFLGAVATALRQRLRRDDASVAWTGFAPVYAMLIVLVINGSGGWLFGWNHYWSEFNVPLVPQSAHAMRGLFGVDDRLDVLAKDFHEDNALVLVRDCGFFQSRSCYGSVFLRNSLSFDGPIVWARYVPGSAQQLADAFPGRRVYIATWDGTPSILPWDPATDP